jgi:hypothetical protein
VKKLGNKKSLSVKLTLYMKKESFLNKMGKLKANTIWLSGRLLFKKGMIL